MPAKTELTIKVEKLSEDKFKSIGVLSWPIWTKEPSTFDWHYDEQERCYFLEGEVTVVSVNQTISFGKGDYVVFPKGLSCKWQVKQAVRKHYKFG